MTTIDSLIIFGFSTDSIKDYTGRLIFDPINGCYIEFLGEMPTNYMGREFLLYGKTANLQLFTAVKCFTPSVLHFYQQHTIHINKLFLGICDSEIEQLEISEIFFRTSYLEHWFGFLPLKYNEDIYSINTKDLIFNDEIQYSESFKLKFPHEWNTDTIKNKQFIFNLNRLISISSNKPKSLDLFERETFKTLNLFKILSPTNSIYLEECFFYFNEKKVEILQKKGFYQQEDNTVNWTDFLVLYNEETNKKLITNWFNQYNKFGLIFDYIYTVFNEQATPIAETQFLFQMQWIEGFCREKFSIEQSEQEAFDTLVSNLKQNFNNDSEEYKWIDKNTKYYKSSFLKHLKKLFTELKDKKYVDFSRLERNLICMKIKTLRDELTHLEGNRKTYQLQELSHINDLLKGIIIFSIMNELEIPINSENLGTNRIISQYTFALKLLCQKKRILKRKTLTSKPKK